MNMSNIQDESVNSLDLQQSRVQGALSGEDMATSEVRRYKREDSSNSFFFNQIQKKDHACVH